MTSSEAPTAIDLSRICQIQENPEPFEPGETEFWTDPHIARQMLASHLDPTVDGASRRLETIPGIEEVDLFAPSGGRTLLEVPFDPLDKTCNAPLTELAIDVSD